MTPVRMPIGSRIRRKRVAVGLTQAGLARALGISASYLNLIENNKRAIGGKLLLRIGERLDIDLESLSGENDARILGALAELMADPVMNGIEVDASMSRDMVTRFPEAAAALVRLYGAYIDATVGNEVLRHRLKSDPFLSQLLHEILNRIAGIKSGAEILATIPDLTEDERNRFIATINAQAQDVVPTVRNLVGYFDMATSQAKPVSPTNEVDDAIIARNNHYPELEDAAETLRKELCSSGKLYELALAKTLEKRFQITCASGSGEKEAHMEDTGKRMLWLPETAPASTRIFRIVRAYASLAASEIIEDTVETFDLSSQEAVAMARRALSSYLAGAIIMPYAQFHDMAEERHYDVELMAGLLGTSFEQVAHRLVTLRRKGREGVPFGFLRADRAGRLSKRFPLPGLSLPVLGHGCLLWPVYSAFSSGNVVRQVSVFPGGARFLQIAKAVSKHPAGFHQQPPLFSIMLACDMLHADRTIYGQGIDPGHPPVEVGPSCLLCPRLKCPHRQETPA